MITKQHACRIYDDCCRAWRKYGKLQREWVEIVCLDVGRGVKQYTAFYLHSQSPIGHVWTREDSTAARRVEVLHSYVMPWCRRKGVRTFIHERILKDADVIISHHGTKDGEPWMVKAGYRWDAEWGCWVFKKARR